MYITYLLQQCTHASVNQHTSQLAWIATAIYVGVDIPIILFWADPVQRCMNIYNTAL